MGEKQSKMFKMISLKEQDTYVYIDVSNIRLACLKTLGLKIDFVKLYEYFDVKYVNLKEVRYYEGIATDDDKKKRMFEFLRHIGYIICPLERKAYNSRVMEERAVECPKCGNKWMEVVMKEYKTMKSNVDVFLTAELLKQANKAKKPTHIILVSCDGDYAEAIKVALENENVSVTVLATPPVKDLKRNTLSVRLRALCREVSRYRLMDISNFKDLIS